MRDVHVTLPESKREAIDHHKEQLNHKGGRLQQRSIRGYFKYKNKIRENSPGDTRSWMKPTEREGGHEKFQGDKWEPKARERVVSLVHNKETEDEKSSPRNGGKTVVTIN